MRGAADAHGGVVLGAVCVLGAAPGSTALGEAMQTMGYLMLPPAGSLPGAVYRRVSHHGAAAAGDCRAAGGALHCSVQRHQQAVPARALFTTCQES